ncbi:MAG: phenylacetate--CoA ligase family protein [Myxococcota bacterium]
MDAAPGIGELGGREEAVASLIDRVRRDVPFYREHLADLRSTALADVPTFGKADLAGYGRFPLSDGTLREVYRVAATSGTTGQRLFVTYSRRDWECIGAQLGQVALRAGFGSGDTLLNTHGFGLWIGGPTLDALADAAGAALIPAGPTGAKTLFEWLPDLPATGISATPSYMRYLVEAAAEAKVDLSSWPLRVGFIGGEGASIALRRRVCAALPEGFLWQELWGSTEVGGPVLAHAPPGDPFAGQVNVDTRTFIVEILRTDADEPVAPGEVGEITVTTLAREQSPLLRYRTRDLAAEIVDGPRDASGLPRMSTSVGRIDDALKVRGTLVYPLDVEEALVACLPHGAEWRIEITRAPGALDVLRIRAEHSDARIATQLAKAVQQRIHLRPEVEVMPPGTLERFQGKARRVVDQRPSD